MLAKRVGGGVTAIAAAAALVIGLSSCSVLEGPTPKTPVRTPPPVPDTPVEIVPDGTAEENLPYFVQILDAYAEGDSPIQGQPIVDAIVTAGYNKADMQVSHDFSRTNLVADSIFVSVRLGSTCLLGQFVTETREWAAYAEDAVGPSDDICLIGEMRVIDW